MAATLPRCSCSLASAMRCPGARRQAAPSVTRRIKASFRGRVRVRASGSENGSSSSEPEPQRMVETSPASAVEGGGSGAGGVIASGAVAGAVTLFAVTRLFGGAPTLELLQADSIPLNEALRNSKPTLVEFYANWCETCREMVPDTLAVEQEYAPDVNFVMLNIDNSRWAEEMSTYQVSGIPQYVFLDGEGRAKAVAVGRVPRDVLQDDVRALAERKEELPYAAVKRVASRVPPPGSSNASTPMPRDHS